MTKEEYLNFCLRYRGCGACFPLYEKLNRFEKMWFTAIQKDVAELEKERAELQETLKTYNGCGDWDNDFHTCRVYLQHEELQMYIEQLTKAKSLLKRCYDYYIYLEPLRSEIEQFINS